MGSPTSSPQLLLAAGVVAWTVLATACIVCSGTVLP